LWIWTQLLRNAVSVSGAMTVQEEITFFRE
jgi:hypothetical protein